MNRGRWQGIPRMQLRAVFVCAFCFLLVGCFTLGPSAEESARMTIDTMFAAQKAGDIENTMALFSDNYSDPQGTIKSQVRQFITGLVYQNAFANITMSMEEATVSVDEDTATVAPVRYYGPTGVSSFAFTLQHEADGIWRVVSARQL